MSSIERIIDRQLRKWEFEKHQRSRLSAGQPAEPRPKPVITVSRQHGSGGTMVAGRLADRFGYTLLHRDIIDRICQSTGLRRHIVESLDERVKPQATIWFESMINMSYVDSSDYVRNLLNTILSISRLGGVVVVGRGSNFMIPAGDGLHVRFVAPRETRVVRVMASSGRSRRESEREVDETDHERREFVRHLSGRDIDDPQAYDLVISTGAISIDSATRMVVDAALEKFPCLRSVEVLSRAPEPEVHVG